MTAGPVVARHMIAGPIAGPVVAGHVIAAHHPIAAEVGCAEAAA